MTTVVRTDPRIENLRVTDAEIVAELADGRVISVPLAWSWRLSDATAEQRSHFRIVGTGQGVHWPDVDEDISVDGMLHGIPAVRPAPAKSGAHRKPRSESSPAKSRQPRPRKTARG